MLPFAARSRLRWPGLPHDESGAPEFRTAIPRSLDLIDRYSLGEYQGLWNRGTWRTVLGTLDLLDRVPPEYGFSSESPSVLDVGSNHWRYFGALSAWLADRGAPRARVTGVELDAFRLYRNLRTPAALANYHTRVARASLQEVRYLAGDVRGVDCTAELVTWFFPFLFEGTVRAWGLPSRVLAPRELARAVIAKLAPGGHCLVVNQGEDEREAMVAAMGPEAHQLWSTRVDESLHEAWQQLFVSIWRRS